jgi:alginate O-acetyltransferase complex protein AlgI
MAFSSNVFLLYFMPVFFLVYFLMPRKTRNYVLLLASLIFYAWGAPEFIVQLVLSTILNFFLVKWMCSIKNPKGRKWLCGISIFIPIGLLLFYKYGNFTMENINSLIGLTGHAPLTWKRILLPIGISFFSFQSVTYTLDTYRGVNPPLKKLSDYMLYITMFPQLIAGPIVRYCDVADQIRQRESTLADRMQGFYRFVIGLSKKILIADVIGRCVDQMLGAAIGPAMAGDVMTRIATLDTGTAWLVALAYTFQIYFDFAGYSDMAIGLGRVMGFKFPENFYNPDTSRSISEF